MRDRRESVRDKVMYGGVAEIGNFGTTRECIVRNISDNGANIEFSNDFQLPREQLSLRIARKGRSFLAKVICRLPGGEPGRADFRHRGTAAQKRDQEAAVAAADRPAAQRTLSAQSHQTRPSKKPAVLRHAGFSFSD